MMDDVQVSLRVKSRGGPPRIYARWRITGIGAIMGTNVLAATVTERADAFEPAFRIPKPHFLDALLLLTGLGNGTSRAPSVVG